MKAMGNLEHVGQSTMPMEGILALRRKLPSDEIIIGFSHQSLERAKFRDQFPSLSAIQTGGKNGRSPNAPHYDQRSTEFNEEQEEFARHKAYNLHKELFKIKRTPQKCSTVQNSSEVTSQQRRRIPAKKDVQCRQWRSVTHDGIIFSES